MQNVNDDLEFAYEVINNESNNYIYSRTNENLEFIFQNEKVANKEVLSVLASSDQYFSFLLAGCKCIDSFDVNPLTEYYYYLRKWCLEKKNILDVYYCSNEVLLDVLKEVKPKDEQEQMAQYFWKTLLVRHDDLCQKILYPQNACLCGRTSFEKEIEKLKVKQCLQENELSFKQINFFQPIENIDKKYDVIYLSNILDWAGTEKCVEMVNWNLINLLNEQGLVICTTFNPAYCIEKKAFQDNFHLKIKYERKRGCPKRPIYYTYVKKRKWQPVNKKWLTTNKK